MILPQGYMFKDSFTQILCGNPVIYYLVRLLLWVILIWILLFHRQVFDFFSQSSEVYLKLISITKHELCFLWISGYPCVVKHMA